MVLGQRQMQGRREDEGRRRRDAERVGIEKQMGERTALWFGFRRCLVEIFTITDRKMVLVVSDERRVYEGRHFVSLVRYDA